MCTENHVQESNLGGSGEYDGDRPPIQDDRKSADKINQTP